MCSTFEHADHQITFLICLRLLKFYSRASSRSDSDRVIFSNFDNLRVPSHIATTCELPNIFSKYHHNSPRNSLTPTFSLILEDSRNFIYRYRLGSRDFSNVCNLYIPPSNVLITKILIQSVKTPEFY